MLTGFRRTGEGRRSPARHRRVGGRVFRRLTPALLCAVLTHPAPGRDTSPPDAGGRETGASDVALSGVLIPTGFQGKKYSAMIQIAVDGSPLPDATWDLGASFLAPDGGPEELSGRVIAGEAGATVVLEFQVEFKPGPYSLTLTAHETTAGQTATRLLRDRWPDPAKGNATVSPVVLLQPAQGAFVRGQAKRGQGALALEQEDRINVQLPTAAVSVVCRGAGVKQPVRVERKLEAIVMPNTVIVKEADETLEWRPASEFKTHRLLPGEEQCAQIRDLIAPGTLREGRFKYVVHLVTDSGRIASGSRSFDAIGGVPGRGQGS